MSGSPFALQQGALHSSSVALPYCCVCILPATIRLHPPQALAAPPTPYGKAKETGRSLQDPPCASAVRVFFHGSTTPLTNYLMMANTDACWLLHCALTTVDIAAAAASSLVSSACLCWRRWVTVQNIGHLCFGGTQSLINNPVFKCVYAWARGFIYMCTATPGLLIHVENIKPHLLICKSSDTHTHTKLAWMQQFYYLYFHHNAAQQWPCIPGLYLLISLITNNYSS